jgi:hypothetical protein
MSLWDRLSVASTTCVLLCWRVCVVCVCVAAAVARQRGDAAGSISRELGSSSSSSAPPAGKASALLPLTTRPTAQLPCLTASIAYSTWNRRPCGLQVVTSVSYCRCHRGRRRQGMQDEGAPRATRRQIISVGVSGPHLVPKHAGSPVAGSVAARECVGAWATPAAATSCCGGLEMQIKKAVGLRVWVWVWVGWWVVVLCMDNSTYSKAPRSSTMCEGGRLTL